MYVNQGYKTLKDPKKCCYNDLYIIAQIMSLAEQPKDVESYECNDNEVKILRASYDKETEKFLGIEQCIAQQFEMIMMNNFSTMALMVKVKQPDFTVKQNIKFQIVLSQHALGLLKTNLSLGRLQKNSPLIYFFYLPSTVDRCETINTYMKGVHLKPTVVNIKELGKDFNPAGSLDRSVVISFMKKAAAVSS